MLGQVVQVGECRTLNDGSVWDFVRATTALGTIAEGWIRSVDVTVDVVVDAPTPMPGAIASDDDVERAFEQLIVDREGRETKVYRDSLGKPTVGIGHLVVPADGLEVGDVISGEQVEAFFLDDSQAAMAAARAQVAEAGIDDPRFLPYLASVNFQLGTGWNLVFKKTWALILDRRYDEAATEAANSKWAVQTPIRLKDFQNALRMLG